MTLDEFDVLMDEGKIQPNHLNNNAPWNECMYETYGEEYEYVKAQPEDKVLTLVSVDCECEEEECECDREEIIEGLHFGNRIGYFILK